MPHRLKTPRWYKKRKIQIQNMDIWNVAFPEGAVIDPHTAWKVFWKTAAAMYGEGGFRKRWVDWSYMNDETHTKGFYRMSIQPNYVDGGFIETHRCQVDRRFERCRNTYGYISIYEDSLEKSEGISYHEFFDWTVNGTRPGLIHVGARRPWASRNGTDSETHNGWYSHLLVSSAVDSHWSDFINLKGNIRIVERGETEKYYNWFSPETFGYSGSEHLNINWDMWWEKVEAGNVEAFAIANLIWCDWLLTCIRPLIECSWGLNHRPIHFVCSKVADVWDKAVLQNEFRCREQVICQFFQTLPVRPLGY